QIMELMVGRELVNDYPERQRPIGKAVLQVANLTNENVADITFDLHEGEILGFGGLVGAGRTEMALALFGADEKQKGTVTLKGEQIEIKSPEKALAYGIGLIPEDRKNQGLVLSLPVKTNISFSILKQLTKYLLIDEQAEVVLCDSLKDDLHIKTHNLKTPAKNLSGGNQQKVVLAKFLATKCDILIFDEPTRGIDVGAKQEIYQLMRSLTEMKKSIIMISSEMPELIGMSDRILVMKDGKINGELEKADFSQRKILEYASI
ncbi:MAG: ATP-binding cassette domain-containing protein, partial [Sphaerochaetaceae bacterium]